MNQEKSNEIYGLILEYEAAKKRGETAFFTEPDFKILIEYFEQEEEYITALQITEDALMHYGYSVGFYLFKAELQITLNQPELALQTLEEASLYSPNDPQINLLRAEASTYMGRFDQARTIVEQLKMERDGETPWVDLTLAEALIFECSQEYESMFYTLKQALEDAPDNSSVLVRFWLAVQLSKKHEESIQVFEELIERNPYASVVWHHLGQTYSYLGYYSEAIDAYEFAIFSSDKFETAYKDCAELCFETKAYRKALKWYLDILELFEPDSDLFLRIGQCYEQLEKHALARTFLTRAMHLDHLNDEVYYHIGCCFAKEEKWRSAINAFEKALKIEEKREEYYAAIAETYYHVGDYDRAEDAFQKAIAIVPEESEYWIRYSSFLLDMNCPQDALDVIKTAEEHLDLPEITYCRIACLFRLGHRQEAYYWLSEALCKDFKMHRSLFKWLPELEEDPAVLSLISTYMA